MLQSTGEAQNVWRRCRETTGNAEQVHTHAEEIIAGILSACNDFGSRRKCHFWHLAGNPPHGW